MKNYKVIFSLIMILMLLVSCGEKTSSKQNDPKKETSETKENKDQVQNTQTETKESGFKEKGYKVAYVLNGTATDIFKMAFDAAVKEGKSLGIQVDVFTTNNDDLKFQDTINQCINQKYDGLYISHGKNDYSYNLVKNAIDAGIKVVTFDTVVETPDKKPMSGLTTMFQDDQGMARISLNYICEELFPDKRPVRLLKLWRGPGIPPFDRRQEVYKEFEEAGKITTLELLGPSNLKDSEGSMNQVVASILPKYPEGSVDAIWSAYDAYARGAYKALYEAKRVDIPLVTIDISNQDINYMLEQPNVWQACIAVHFENIGIQGIRLLAMKLHGDETPEVFNLQPSIVKADMIKEGANVMNLGEIIPGYGLSDENLTDWMKELQK